MLVVVDWRREWLGAHVSGAAGRLQRVGWAWAGPLGGVAGRGLDSLWVWHRVQGRTEDGVVVTNGVSHS